MSIKVFGHINPDTDSTLSPMVYAWFLNQIGDIAEPVLLGEANREAKYLLERFGFETPRIIDDLKEGEEVILIDTNNAEELLKSVEHASIIEIIDHHKLFGNLTTDKPIDVTIKTYACTATIIYEIIEAEELVQLTPKYAGLLLGAILSDTLKFTSPTTTKLDIEVAKKLAKIADVNIDELATEMFAAKSDLTGMSIEDILSLDSKDFNFGGDIARIAVLETTNPEVPLAMKEDIIKEIPVIKNREDLKYFFFYIIDILKSEATLIAATPNESDLAAKAHNVTFEADTVLLPGIVSRKKQIAPVLENAI